jgi:hypothetical protein
MRKVDLVREDDGRVVMPGAALRGADLRDADLRGANLRWAFLAEANLWRADLEGADLRGAELMGALLGRADLLGADLRGADLRGADLRDAHLRGAIGIDEVPRAPVPGLAARVLEQITGHLESLDMRSWHSDCGTKHCFAGWAVTLAGEAGKAAEKRLDTASAARFLLGGSEHPFESHEGDEVIPWLEARVKDEESDARS